MGHIFNQILKRWQVFLRPNLYNEQVRIMVLRLVGLIFVFGSFLSHAQSTYLKTAGTNVSDYGTSCIPTPNQGSVITISGGMVLGSGVQFSLVQTDHAGDLEWEKVFVHNSFALAQNVVRTQDGGLAVFGTINKSSGANKSLFVLKTDALGNEEWSYEMSASSNDRPAALIACASGGFLTCSTADYNLGGYPSALLIRYSDDGTVLWAKKYSVLQGIEPRSLVELPDGDFAFVSSVNAAFMGPFRQTLVSRTDSLGVLRWSSMFSTSEYDSEPHDLATNQIGELFVCGTSSRSLTAWDGFLLKVDADGHVLFNTFYDAGTSNGEQFRSLVHKDNGNLLLLGDMGTFDERDISMLEVNPSGQIVWSRRYPISLSFTNYGLDVYEAEDEGIVFTGDVRPPSYARDAAVFKTDSKGNVACYVQDAIYTVDATPFSEMTLFLAEQEHTLLDVQPVVFTHPVDQITGKVICENHMPVPDMSTESFTECPKVCVDFTDESQNDPTSWFWEFEGGTPSVSTEQHPTGICYDQPGLHTVRLTVTNAYGSVSKELSVFLEEFDCPLPDMPNVFTPNGDGINDVFELKQFPPGAVLRIYNRWGELVFETESQGAWDGSTQQGLPCSDGVYFYRLDTKKKTVHGFIHLQR